MKFKIHIQNTPTMPTEKYSSESVLVLVGIVICYATHHCAEKPELESYSTTAPTLSHHLILRITHVIIIFRKKSRPACYLNLGNVYLTHLVCKNIKKVIWHL